MNTILKLERNIVQWLAQDYQHRVLRVAMRRAYKSFAKCHPEKVATLFDEHFVLTRLLPLLESATCAGVTVTPYQVALLWAQHFGILPTTQGQHIATVLPAAKDFLELVADALSEGTYPMEHRVARWPQQDMLQEAAQAQWTC